MLDVSHVPAICRLALRLKLAVDISVLVCVGVF